MPNAYDLKATRGALALHRRWEVDPDRPSLPPLGGGGSRAGRVGVSTAGRIQKTWSSRSRRRMRFEFSALPWELLGHRPVMLTLTYPGEWDLWVPNSAVLRRHREAFKERWRRRWGPPIGAWVVEFQTRGAPHLHLYLALPDQVSDSEYLGLQKRTIRRKADERRMSSYEARSRMRAPRGEFGMWLRTAWWEVVGSELKAHHGRGVDIATAFFSEQAESEANRVRVGEYFWRESGKWKQKTPPEGFGGLKFYGRWGQKQGFNPVVSTDVLNERVGLELRRMMRHLMRVKQLEAAARTGRKVPRNAGKSRGRDGLTVFGIDGTVWGPRLQECAEGLALEKAQFEGADFRLLSRRHGIRALSEIPVERLISSETAREVEGPDDDPDLPSWIYEEAHEAELAEAALLAQIEAAEEAERVAEDAIVDHMEREHRKAQLRRADGWMGPEDARTKGAGRRRP